MTYVPVNDERTAWEREADRLADERWQHDHHPVNVEDPAARVEWAAPVASCASAH